MKKRYTAVLLALMMFTGVVSCSSASSASTSDGGSIPVETTTQKEVDENTDNDQDTGNSDTKLFSISNGVITAELPTKWNYDESTDTMIHAYPSGSSDEAESFTTFYGDLDVNYGDADTKELLETNASQGLGEGDLKPEIVDYKSEFLDSDVHETIFKQSYVSDYTSAGYNIRIYSEEYYFPVNHDGVFGIMMIGYMYDADKEPKYEEDFWNVFVPAIKLNGTAQTASENKATKEEDVPAGELSVEKGVIYEENDVVISVDNIQKGNTATTLSFVIENNSDSDYNVAAHSWDINGIMIGDNQYGFNSVETAAGKKSRLNLEVDNSVLESKGINYISEIDVLFWFYGDSMKQWDSGLLNIKTSQYSEELRATVDKEPDYADDVVEVWYAGNDSKNNYTFWVHNKSSYNAECTIENCSVNDWSYELTEYTFDAYGVLVNSDAYVAITIPVDKEFAKTNGIEKIENIEFDVLIEDNNWDLKGDLWKHKSDKITFSEF